MLLAEREPSKIRWRLGDFYDAALLKTTRLANTIQTWWPAIMVAFIKGRTEGFNHRIKQTK